MLAIFLVPLPTAEPDAAYAAGKCVLQLDLLWLWAGISPKPRGPGQGPGGHSVAACVACIVVMVTLPGFTYY